MNRPISKDFSAYFYIVNEVTAALVLLVALTAVAGVIASGSWLGVPTSEIVASPLRGFAVLSVPMLVSFVLLPISWERWVAHRSFAEMGVWSELNSRTKVWLVGALAVLLAIAVTAHLQAHAPLLAEVHFTLIGIAEETLFRSVVHSRLRQLMPPLAAVLITSLAFVFVLHHDEGFVMNLIWRLPLALALGWSFERTNLVWVPAALHGAYDILVSWL